MLLQESDIIKLEKGHCIYVDVPKHFVYANHIGNFETTHEAITIGDPGLGFDTRFMVGKWAVYKTTMDGGGGSSNDEFPSGHHVFCERLLGKDALSSEHRMRVDFYQTGCFTAMIEAGDIGVVGKVEIEYKEATE